MSESESERDASPPPCPSQTFRNISLLHPFTPHLLSPTRPMDSLLRWSIENSTPRSADAPPPARKDIDPEIIDYILGKSDAVLMKEALEIALDESKGDEGRIRALGDLEMLVEQIDNANGTSVSPRFMFSGKLNLFIRPRKAEDVAATAIPFNISKLVR